MEQLVIHFYFILNSMFQLPFPSYISSFPSMGFRFVPIFAMALILAVAARHAPPIHVEKYWTSVFPNTPMPDAFQNLLLPSDAAKNMKAALVDMVNTYNKDTIERPQKRLNGRYGYASADVNVPSDKDLYFFESKLHPGSKVHFEDLTIKATKLDFLPRSVADSIPFSTQEFAQVLNYFSVKPESAESKILKEAIEDCERPAFKGENKYCASSFESFVDSSVSMMGKNIKLVSTELEKETQNQEFTIGEGVKVMGKSEIVCHKMDYPYAMFMCHSIDKSDVYKVPLVGEDGTRATALAVCHKDTSPWNPKHLAFQVLKVKPGTIPICHFLTRDTLVWIPN